MSRRKKSEDTRLNAAMPHCFRDDQYVDEIATTEITGFSKFTLRNFRHLRQGPPYVKHNRSVRYLVADVRAWMEGHKVTP